MKSVSTVRLIGLGVVKTTNHILVLLSVSLHVLTAVLLGVGLLSASQGEALNPVTLLLVAAFAAVYLAGTVWAHQGREVSRAASYAWLALIVALWAALGVRTSAFVWLEFPLVILAQLLLPSGLGLSVAAALLVATLGRTVPDAGWAGFIGPTIGTLLAVFIVYAYQALRQETEMYKALEHAAGVAEERARLSREVHDTMAQGLSSIVLLGRALDKQLGGNEKARATLDTIRATASENLAAARRFVAVNAPPAAPLPTRLRELAAAAEERQRALGRALRVQVNADVDVPEPAASVIERVVREGVSNIERHSRADLAVITVDVSGDGSGGVATVDVYDNGDGIIGEEGFGIKGLRARLAEVGGTLTIDGSVLAASVPVEEQ